MADRFGLSTARLAGNEIPRQGIEILARRAEFRDADLKLFAQVI